MRCQPALSSFPPTKWQQWSNCHSSLKKMPQELRCLRSALQAPRSPNVFLQKHYSPKQHMQPGWHLHFASEGFEKIKWALALYICTNYRPVMGTESNYFTGLSSSGLKSLSLPILIFTFPSDTALEGTLILYALFVCPKEVKVPFGPGSLGKAAIQLTWNLGFLKAKFKEMISCMEKKNQPKTSVSIKHPPGRTSCLTCAMLPIV